MSLMAAMEIGDILNIGSMNFPDGVTATLNDDVVVAIVAKTRVAKSAEGAEAEADAAAEPEVTNEKSEEA